MMDADKGLAGKLDGEGMRICIVRARFNDAITTALSKACLAELAAREPLLFPATLHSLGAEPGGFVFDNQKWAHDVAVPEFEIEPAGAYPGGGFVGLLHGA